MLFRIEVKEGNVVEIFDDAANHGLPFLRQPHWPNNAPWADEAEARGWAEMFVESMSPESTHFAPDGPEEERLPKPTPEQIAEWQGQVESLGQ